MKLSIKKIETLKIDLQKGKKVYFASDFHLGFPTLKDTKEREEWLCLWLRKIEKDAQAIFLVGDIFDFWVEYKNFIPKVGVMFLAKLQELSKKGVDIYFFSGNHDNWWRNYFKEYIEIKECYKYALMLNINAKKLFIHHGHYLYRTSMFSNWLNIFFKSWSNWILVNFIHPEWLARACNKIFTHSQTKRQFKEQKRQENSDDLIHVAEMIIDKYEVDIVVLGHRHKPIDHGYRNKQYINLGEWIYNPHYGVYDGEIMSLAPFLPQK